MADFQIRMNEVGLSNRLKSALVMWKWLCHYFVDWFWNFHIVRVINHGNWNFDSIFQEKVLPWKETNIVDVPKTKQTILVIKMNLIWRKRLEKFSLENVSRFKCSSFLSDLSLVHNLSLVHKQAMFGKYESVKISNSWTGFNGHYAVKF